MNWILISVILFLILLLSAALNIFLLWYGWKSIQQIKYYDDELTETMTVIHNFTNHLKSVYELEMFYGDETLRHLLRHAQDLTEAFDEPNLYAEDDITEEEFINDDITESRAQEEKAPQDPQKQKFKKLFHTNSRRRN
jgi:hypothetical protein